MSDEKEERKTTLGHIGALYERLEKLEKALSDHMALHRGDESAPDEPMPGPIGMIKVQGRDPMWVVPNAPVYGDGWAIAIDPMASPKGLPFEIALMYLKAGREVKRERWENGISTKNLFRFGASHHDLTAVDWEVVSQQKPDEPPTAAQEYVVAEIKKAGPWRPIARGNGSVRCYAGDGEYCDISPVEVLRASNAQDITKILDYLKA